jgi:hypothetical protein
MPKHRFRKVVKRRGAGFAILLFFLILALVFTRPMITKGSDHVYREPYDPMFQAWTLAWDVRALTHDPLNLFNANIFFPNQYTLAYSDHQVATAVMSMPLMAATGNPIQAANYMLIFNFFLCEVGAYLLVMHLTQSRLAGVVAGIAFAFALPRMAQMGHLQLSAAAFIPLCLLFLHRYSEEGRPRDAAVCGLFLVLETLSTWYYGMILAFAILIFLIVRFIMKRRAFTLKWIATFAAVIAVAVLVVVPFGLPYQRIHEKDPRYHRDIDEVTLFSADVRDFTAAAEDSLVWRNVTAAARNEANERGGKTERSLFPGLVPLILGIAGAAYLFAQGRGAARFDVRYYVTLAAAAFLMCLGTSFFFFGHKLAIPMPYHLFYYAFPGFKVMRVPARFSILISLSLAVLSGFAVKGMMSWLGRRRRGKALLTLLVSVVVLGLLLVDLMPVSLPMTRIPLKDQFPGIYTWLAERQGEAPTAELPLADYNPRTFNAGIQYEPTWAEREGPRTYFSTLHWKKIFNGYSGFIPTTYYMGVKVMSNFPSQKSIDFLRNMGIEYVIVHGRLLEPAKLQSVLDWDARHRDFQLLEKSGQDYAFRINR